MKDDPMQRVRALVVDGVAALAGESEGNEDFVLSCDLDGVVDGLRWRPVSPVLLNWSELAELGEVRQAARLPDSGLATAVVYLEGGRLLLTFEPAGPAALVAELQFTGF